MIILYRLFLILYQLAIRAAALRNPKARAWVRGRTGVFEPLAQSGFRRRTGQKRIWMHCASLGEFEQGRPVIEAIRKEWPDAFIILSFFSPSGYEIRKNYELADLVSYLPMDGPANARRFLDIVDPDVALFVKYEFWHYYLQTLAQRNIPAILVSGAFRKSQPFFKPWGGFFRRILDRFTILTVQDEGAKRLLEQIGMGGKAIISGDTRFDRVLEIALKRTPVEKVAAFCAGAGRVIIAGSTWPKDEEMLATAWPELKGRLNAGTRLIIAPHELGEAHIAAIETLFRNVDTTARFSDPISKISEAQILIVDNMGMLSNLYQYGDMALIGGGFNKGGIHNVLEPAVFGLPVIMGPVYEKFTEAVALVKVGYAFPVQDAAAFVAQAGLLLGSARQERLPTLQAEIRDFVKTRGGATGRVIEVLRKLI